MGFRVSQQQISWMACVCAATCLLNFSASNCGAALYLNEIFFDPGSGGSDEREEFIELRGDPNMPLANHYLIILENEDDLVHEGRAGEIDNIFDLGAYKVGRNGFLTMRQKSNIYNVLAAPPAGTTDLVNSGSGAGWGSGPGSTIGHTGQNGKVIMENSGFTAMLIHDLSAANGPSIGQDLDNGNDGLDSPEQDDENGDWNDYWEIVDAIGVFSEPGRAGLGRLYGTINYGPEILGQPLDPSDGGVDDGTGNFVFQNVNIEPDAVYVGLGYEIEYLARWGNSTGQTNDDWHASNITLNSTSGSLGLPDFRQSGGLHDGGQLTNRVETNQGVSYGVSMVTTLGRPNLFYKDGDFDLDGDVDSADLTRWESNYGYGTGLTFESLDTALRTHGDTNGDWIVDGLDFLAWQRNYAGSVPLVAAASAVPEPTSLALFAIAAGLVARIRHRFFVP